MSYKEFENGNKVYECVKIVIKDEQNKAARLIGQWMKKNLPISTPKE
jgi:hypothetical protein